jgi:hypothetical protein
MASDAYQANHERIFGRRDVPAAGRRRVYLRGQWRQTGEAVVRQRDNVNIESRAAGVLPEQVPEATAELARRGIEGVRYKPDGKVVFRDRAAKLAFMRHSGLYDRDEIRSPRHV